MMTPEQIARLPKAAQQLITKLRADAEYWQRRALPVEQQCSDVIVEPYGLDGNRAGYLPNDARVRFVLQRQPEQYIDVAIRDGMLQVQGNDQLQVYMQSSNLCSMRSEWLRGRNANGS